MTEQIYYGSWSAELAPGHEDYWWTVGTIANWIGYALASNTGHWRGSTIDVAQTKEKFGECRVYIDLAAYELVNQRWLKDKGTEPEEDSVEYKEFVNECVERDRGWYRRVYLEAQRMWPQYRQVITAAADYSEFTYPTQPEFDAYWKKFTDRNKHIKKEDFNKERDEVYELCGWSNVGRS